MYIIYTAGFFIFWNKHPSNTKMKKKCRADNDCIYVNFSFRQLNSCPDIFVNFDVSYVNDERAFVYTARIWLFSKSVTKENNLAVIFPFVGIAIFQWRRSAHFFSSRAARSVFTPDYLSLWNKFGDAWWLPGVNWLIHSLVDWSIFLSIVSSCRKHWFSPDRLDCFKLISRI